MKKFLIIFLALAIGLVGGYFVYQKFFKDKGNGDSVDNKEVILSKVSVENYNEPFQWGINVNLSPVRNYSLEMWNKQMKYVINLGTDWTRITYIANVSDRLEIFDEVVENTISKNIQILLSLDSTEPVQTIANPYDDGYKVASEAAERYKGKIKYYQILNEIGGTVVKGPEFSGESENDVDRQKYNNVKEWIRGAVTAVREIDPDAYIIIDSFWTHYAVIDMLIKDGINFDILGWNWYSDMKQMGDKKLSDDTLLIDKLKSYNKPIILAEVNGTPNDSAMDQDKQAEFITTMANWAYNSGYISGFYVHELVDIAPTSTREAGYFGIMEYKKSGDGGYTFGDPKKAYYDYQEIIQKYNSD